jgi:hypothetical protein
MMHKFLVIVFIALSIFRLHSVGKAQCNPEDMVFVEGSLPVIPSYILSKPSGIAGSTIGYCPAFYNPEHGASYLLLYEDQGGTGMDGYPCIKAGGAQYNNAWYPGDPEITGMPVQIQDIHPDMHFELVYSQEEAWDDEDKWMASVNFIFDIYGTEESKPVTEDRDFDIVVKAQSHNFDGDVLTDQPIPVNTRFWFFARNEEGSLKTFDVKIDDITYSYAVRYKFFEGDGPKDNKAHVKFIPVGPAGVPPVMKINVQEIINVSKEYIEYTAMPEKQRVLAETNIGAPGTWLKGINAGYEVYTGESTLRIDRFRVFPGIPAARYKVASSDDFEVMCWPNPVVDLIHWKCTVSHSAEILNISGDSTSAIISRNHADLSKLPEGVYLLKLIFIDGKTTVKKFIKK